MIGKRCFRLASAAIALTVATGPVLYAASAPKAGAGAGASASAETPAVPPVVKSTCMACHGMRGISVTATYPDLAGQWKSYLTRQLMDFKSHARADPQAPVMWSMAAPLDKKQIQQIAQYFAEQPHASAHVYDPKLAAVGRKLYYGGIPSEKVPACMACHGATLAGIPPFFPMLAGQKRGYVKEQLEYFKAGKRANDPKGMMRYIASKLDKKQITALAEFIRAH